MLADGEYANAMNMFRRDLNDAYHFGQSRWIDSICSYTMLGESQYRIGDYRDALENFENAHAALQSVFQLDAAVHAVSRRARAGTTAKARTVGQEQSGVSSGEVSGNVPDRHGHVECRCDQHVAHRRTCSTGTIVVDQCRRNCALHVPGHAAAQANPWPVGGTRFAHRRSAGPDGQAQGQPDHWSEAWLDAQQGMAYRAAGKTGQAIKQCSDRSPWGRGSSIIP